MPSGMLCNRNGAKAMTTPAMKVGTLRPGRRPLRQLSVPGHGGRCGCARQVVGGLGVVGVDVSSSWLVLRYPDVQQPDDDVAEHDARHNEKDVHRLWEAPSGWSAPGYHVRSDDAPS